MVVNQNTTQEACKTKYVYLEMILAKDSSKYDVVSGLFKGIYEKGGDKYILLHGLRESTNVLNTKFYNIMMIEELADDYKNMAYMNSEETDQKDAMEMVEELYASLMLAGFGLENDPKILDISKFQEVPKEYIEGKQLEKTAVTSTTTSTGVGSFAAPGNRFVGAGGVYTKTQPKADPEPAVLRRSQAKKPTKAELDLMEEKINQIMNKTFIPVLPETMGEDADGKGVAEEVADENSYYGHYGM